MVHEVTKFQLTLKFCCKSMYVVYGLKGHWTSITFYHQKCWYGYWLHAKFYVLDLLIFEEIWIFLELIFVFFKVNFNKQYTVAYGTRWRWCYSKIPHKMKMKYWDQLKISVWVQFDILYRLRYQKIDFIILVQCPFNMAWEKILEILNVTRDMTHQGSTVTSTYQKLSPHCFN